MLDLRHFIPSDVASITGGSSVCKGFDFIEAFHNSIFPSFLTVALDSYCILGNLGREGTAEQGVVQGNLRSATCHAPISLETLWEGDFVEVKLSISEYR